MITFNGLMRSVTQILQDLERAAAAFWKAPLHFESGPHPSTAGRLIQSDVGVILAA